MNESRYREAERRLWQSIGVTPREQRLRLARDDVTVRVQEVGEGPAAVFVHGANTTGTSWATLAARMAGFRCILVDRPGTGLSEPLRGRLDVDRVLRLAETLVVDVLDALGLTTAHLVATSFGGFVALRSAAAHPDRVGRMVQFSWPAGAPIERLPLSMRVNAVPGLGRLVAALPASERSVRLLFRSLGHGPSLADGRITAADLDCYLALLRSTDTMPNELALGRVVIGPLRGPDPRLLPERILRAVASPTLFLWGERDPFGGPAVAHRVARSLPRAELEVLAGAGHAPWLDQLQHCADVAGAFLARS